MNTCLTLESSSRLTCEKNNYEECFFSGLELRSNFAQNVTGIGNVSLPISTRRTKIFDGQAADWGEWPWAVRLWFARTTTAFYGMIKAKKKYQLKLQWIWWLWLWFKVSVVDPLFQTSMFLLLPTAYQAAQVSNANRRLQLIFLHNYPWIHRLC